MKTMPVTGVNFAMIYSEAYDAGSRAALACTPVPMVVVEHSNMLDDSSPIKKIYEPVMDGVCGFAWINIRPASKQGLRDCAFVKWLRARKIGSYDDYSKCWSIRISDYNQSMTRKDAHAHAMAEVLYAHGIDAYACSRMD